MVSALVPSAKRSSPVLHLVAGPYISSQSVRAPERAAFSEGRRSGDRPLCAAARIHSASATTRRRRLQLSRVAQGKSAKRRLGGRGLGILRQAHASEAAASRAAGNAICARRHTAGRQRATLASPRSLWRNEEDSRGVLLLLTPGGPRGDRDRAGGSARVRGPTAGRSGPHRLACLGRVLGRGDGPGPQSELRGAATGQGAGGDQAGGADRHGGCDHRKIVAATGWQPHTVRGAFAGARKKRLGLTIVTNKVEARGRVYRLG